MTNADRPAGSAPDGPHPVHPRNYLRPCLLLLLAEEPAYGYELRDRLAQLSAASWDHGTVYRALNLMEEDGLVRSSWERSAEGPRRRRYRITGAGGGVLDEWARELCGLRNTIIRFIERYQFDRQDSPALPDIPERVLTAVTGAGQAGRHGAANRWGGGK